MNPNNGDDVVAAAREAAQSAKTTIGQFESQFGEVKPPVTQVPSQVNQGAELNPNPPAIEAVPQPKPTPVSILVQEITDALEKFKAASF